MAPLTDPPPPKGSVMVRSLRKGGTYHHPVAPTDYRPGIEPLEEEL